MFLHNHGDAVAVSKVCDLRIILPTNGHNGSVGDVGYFSILAGNIQRPDFLQRIIPDIGERHNCLAVSQRPEAGDKGSVIVLLRDQLQQGGVVDGKVPNESFLFGGKADGQNACFLINFIPGVGCLFFQGASVSFSFTGVLSAAPGQQPCHAGERQDQGKYLFCVVFFFLNHIMLPRFYFSILKLILISLPF